MTAFREIQDLRHLDPIQNMGLKLHVYEGTGENDVGVEIDIRICDGNGEWMC